MSEFRIAIRRVDGRDVQLVPGAQGERDLIEDVLTRAQAKGVGVFRTEAHVLADVRAALAEALHALKAEVVL
jgi:hypothetical protein